MAEANQSALDHQGTSEGQGRELLRRLRDKGFDADDAKLAQALGRPIEEVQGWLTGSTPLDDDLVMKARALAQERGINIK